MREQLRLIASVAPGLLRHRRREHDPVIGEALLERVDARHSSFEMRLNSLSGGDFALTLSQLVSAAGQGLQRWRARLGTHHSQCVGILCCTHDCVCA